MLRIKLATEVSPPKMSIFWAEPWPDPGYALAQEKQYPDQRKNDVILSDGPFGGFEHNWARAMKIYYAGTVLRVFPDEFSILSPQSLGDYIAESHEFIPDSAACDELNKQSLPGGIAREIYEAALLDGCDTWQARLMAQGIDVTEPNYEIPPIGWYRIKEEYGLVFCTERELSGDDHHYLRKGKVSPRGLEVAHV